jgi:Arc/MetJ-type ribon-helix-helix transcriptional regulator
MISKGKTYSVSLAPIHEEQIRRIEERIRSIEGARSSRSEAVQIAVLSFDHKKDISELVHNNQKFDQRRRRK